MQAVMKVQVPLGAPCFTSMPVDREDWIKSVGRNVNRFPQQRFLILGV